MHPRAPRAMAIRAVSAGALIVAAAAAGADLQPAGPQALAAIEICQQSDAAPADQRPALLDAGLALAERAAAENPRDHAAHFAIFCNLGRSLMHRSTWKLLGTLGDLRRARRAIDQALALAPDYPPALAAKGAMLAQLPRVLGGDREEGVRLLLRAVALQPADATLHLTLAEVLRDAGELDAARAEASTAIAILERAGPADDLVGARALAASVD